MAKHIVKKGATSRMEYLFIQDSASAVGAGKTGLAFGTASLVAYYVRRGAAPVAITLITQTVTGAYSSGGFVEVDATNMPGLYRLDVPDAAFASGVNKIVVMLKGASGMAPVLAEFQLVDFDPESATSLGLTNLDATISSRMATFTYTAPLDAAGTRAALGLATANLDTQLAAAVTITAAAIRSAVGLATANLDTQLAAAATITAAAIRTALGLSTANLDTQLSGINSKTTNLPASPAAVGSAMTLTTGERTAIANEVEAQIIDETDSEKVLTAITDKIAAVNPDLGGLTLSAIASAVRTNLTTELGRIDVATSTRLATAGYTAPLDAAGTRTAVGLATANLDTQLAAAATVTASTIRSAVGLGSANLDTQLDALPTNAELASGLAAADDAVLAAIDNLPTNAELATALAAADDAVLAAIAGIDASGVTTLLGYATRTVIRGTVGTGSSTTTIVPSAIDVAAASADQFKGRIVLFDKDTVTPALRGEGGAISASSNDALSVITLSALTAVPADGDTFSIV